LQVRANVEPGQISNLLGRHPFGLSFYPVVPVPRNGALPLNVCCRRRAGMEAWSRLPFYFHNNRPLTGPCP
jgi:hypothetical protein